LEKGIAQVTTGAFHMWIQDDSNATVTRKATQLIFKKSQQNV